VAPSPKQASFSCTSCLEAAGIGRRGRATGEKREREENERREKVEEISSPLTLLEHRSLRACLGEL
jgi:hypothetical protein